MEPIHRLAAEHGVPEPPPRRRMPTERESLTHKFCVDGHEGYLTAGLYEDGTVGELFITDFGKEGSTLRGVFSAWATTLSIALQHGVPLESAGAQVRLHALRAARRDREPGRFPRQAQHSTSCDDVARWLASPLPRRRHAGRARRADRRRQAPPRHRA